MGQRVLVTVEPDADVQDVVRRLRDLGRAEVAAPDPYLPGVCVVTLDDGAPRDWITRARAVDGVRTAEPDSLRWDL